MNRLGKPVALNIWPMRYTSADIKWSAVDRHYPRGVGLRKIDKAFYHPYMEEIENNPCEWSLRYDPLVLGTEKEYE